MATAGQRTRSAGFGQGDAANQKRNRGKFDNEAGKIASEIRPRAASEINFFISIINLSRRDIVFPPVKFTAVNLTN